MVRETPFCSVDSVLRNVGGIECQPFLTTGNEHENVLVWKRTLRLLSKMEPPLLLIV